MHEPKCDLKMGLPAFNSPQLLTKYLAVPSSWTSYSLLCEQQDQDERAKDARSEEHTSELQSLMRISYAVFCLTKKKQLSNIKPHTYIKNKLYNIIQSYTI